MNGRIYIIILCGSFSVSGRLSGPAVLIPSYARMDGGIPESALSALLPPLAGWVREHGLHRGPGLANFFSDAEMQTGAAALELFQDIGTLEEDQFARFAAELDKLVDFAKVLAAQRQRGFASVPEFTFRFERLTRERAAKREAEDLRLRAEELRRLRAEAPPIAPQPRLGYRPRRAHLRHPTVQGREEADRAKRAKWLDRLHEILVQLEAPILGVLSGSRRPRELLESHMAGRRAATLAARIRVWSRYRAWLRQACGVGHPAVAPQILDYLLDRRAEPCTRGTLSAIFSAMKFADEAMGIPLGARLTEDPVVVALAKGIIGQAPASLGQRSPGPANAPLVSVPMRLEAIVCDEGRASPDRLHSWWMLISSWTACRFDDHRGLAPRDVVCTDGDVDLTFRRSKTTGEDKPVRLRRTAISKDAWLFEPRWLGTGLELWNELAPRARDYFLIQWGLAGTPCYREQSYVEYAGRMRGLLASFADEDGSPLGAEWATYLRPHSWRSFLPSVTVALGAPSEELKWISAWKARGSDSYVRTSRARTLVTQTMVARLLKLQLGEADPVGEGHALCGLRKHLQERGVGEDKVDRISRALQVYGDRPTGSPLWGMFAAAASDKESHESVGDKEGNTEIVEDADKAET